MKKLLLITTIAAILSSCKKDDLPLVTSESKLRTETLDTLDMNYTDYNPCNNDSIILTGYLLLKAVETVRGNVLTINYGFNYSNVTAISMNTGKEYKILGLLKVSYTDTFQIIDGDLFSVNDRINVINRLEYVLGNSKYEAVFYYHVVKNKLIKYQSEVICK